MKYSVTARGAIVLLAFAAVVIGVRPAASIVETSSDLPNLVALPPFELDMAPADDAGHYVDPDEVEQALRFSVATANEGHVPLEVVGVPDMDMALDAQQCVEWVDGQVCGVYTPVGKFIYHDDHRHWHFNHFALYALRTLTSEGLPDWDQDAVVRSNKVSFCMADSYTEQPNVASLYVARYTEFCPGVVQGISPGWQDIYRNGLYGQQLLLTGVPDGFYALTVTVNPDAALQESSTTDNRAYVVVEIKDERWTGDPDDGGDDPPA